jgi:glycosyl transferase family WbsX
MADSATEFVAYAYPGWHASPYRAGLDEWALLDEFRPYFPGHVRPASPLWGRYDDTQPAVAARQISCASEYGLRGFSYFSYFGHDGFVMDEPARVALDVAKAHPDFRVALTLCLRLPHRHLPLPRAYQHWRSQRSTFGRAMSGTISVTRAASSQPHAEGLSVGDFSRLVGPAGDGIPIRSLRRLAQPALSPTEPRDSVADSDSGHVVRSLQRLEPLSVEEASTLFELWSRQFAQTSAYWRIKDRPVCAFLNIADYVHVYGLARFALILEIGRSVFRRVLHVDPFFIGVIGQASSSNCALVNQLPLDAVTGYGLLPDWSGPPVQEYDELIQRRIRDWYLLQDQLAVPFIPVACSGWDASVRGEWAGDLHAVRGFPWRPVINGVSCEAFGRFVAAACAFNRRRHPNLQVVFLHAWNEWTESSAIEPSDRFGFGFLDQVRELSDQSIPPSIRKRQGDNEHVR